MEIAAEDRVRIWHEADLGAYPALGAGADLDSPWLDVSVRPSQAFETFEQLLIAILSP
jgi:hypothetical protein